MGEAGCFGPAGCVLGCICVGECVYIMHICLCDQGWRESASQHISEHISLFLCMGARQGHTRVRRMLQLYH